MKLILQILCFLPLISLAQLSIQSIETNIDASFRGISAVDDKIAWVSGSNGTVGLSVDGGQSWKFIKVKGHEGLDFRSIYAFDEKHAVIANAGSPGYIFRTIDGGLSWEKVFEDQRPEIFIDGIDFWNSNEGIIYGDPIDGQMLMFRTYDGGKTWKDVPTSSKPSMVEGEASFAASGTNIRCLGPNAAMIASGGVKSRIFVTTNQGNDWFPIETPIIQGLNTTGIYSVAWHKNGKAIIVGGDYTKMDQAENHVFYSTTSLEKWEAPETQTRGYRECVEFIDDRTVIALGPTGVDISLDEGRNWKSFSDEEGYHTIRKSRNGNLVVLAGGKGKIGILK